MNKRTTARILKIFSFTTAVAVLLLGFLSGTLSPSAFRILLVTAGCLLLLLVFCADRFYRSLVSDFSNDICETVDALMEDREPDNFQPYEDSAVSKAQGKLLQYYDKMRDEHRQSDLERQTLQELVSDISHQVKTPVANIQMFTGILREHELDPEKRNEFLNLMSAQISKLDFLMQSLIKMSRLETGTFTIHMEESRLSDTIARAVSAVWAKAEQKDLQIDVDCGSDVLVRHDAKWTAEALGNTPPPDALSGSGSVPGSSTPGSTSQTPASALQKNITTMYSVASTGRRRWHRRKGSDLVCILPAGSSPGSTAISASSQNRGKEAHSPSIFLPEPPCFSS